MYSPLVVEVVVVHCAEVEGLDSALGARVVLQAVVWRSANQTYVLWHSNRTFCCWYLFWFVNSSWVILMSQTLELLAPLKAKARTAVSPELEPMSMYTGEEARKSAMRVLKNRSKYLLC